MSEQDSPAISFSYRIDESQLPDYYLGVQHQQYENYRMTLSTKWDRHLMWVRTDLSLRAGLAAAAIYAFGLPFIPGVWALAGYWVLGLAPVVAAAVWLVLWHGGRKPTSEYADAITRWHLEFAKMHSGEQHVTIGPSGARFATKTESMEFTWFRYHLAIVQPEHLVLVFHEAVIAIPNGALPGSPGDVVRKINDWAERYVAEHAPGPAPS